MDDTKQALLDRIEADRDMRLDLCTKLVRAPRVLSAYDCPRR